MAFFGKTSFKLRSSPAAIGGAGIFNPLKDPLLIDFWDGGSPLTIDEVLNSVSEWRGTKSATPMTNGTVSAQPQTNVRQTPNGVNALDFQANADALRNLAFTHPEFNFSVFIVALVDTSGNTSQSLVSTQSIGVSRDYQLTVGVTGEMRFASQVNNLGPNITPANDFIGEWHIFNSEGDWDSSLRTQYVDGVDEGNAAYTTQMNPDQELRFGANRNEVRKIDGPIAAVVITAAVDTATRQKYQGYLAWKYGGL